MVEWSNMQDVRTFTLIIFIVYGIFLFSNLLLSHKLFRSLKKNHTKYYESVGRPIAFTPAFATSDVILQVWKTTIYLNSLVFRGVPRNFPTDVKLVRLAKIIRVLFCVIYFLIAVLLVLVYQLWLVEKA